MKLGHDLNSVYEARVLTRWDLSSYSVKLNADETYNVNNVNKQTM